MDNVWRDFRFLMSVLTMVAQNSFDGKSTVKTDLLIRYFVLPLLMLTIKVRSLSKHYLKNLMVRNILNFALFDKK